MNCLPIKIVQTRFLCPHKPRTFKTNFLVQIVCLSSMFSLVSSTQYLIDLSVSRRSPKNLEEESVVNC